MMNPAEKIRDVQKRLVEQKIDGWLLYDFHRMNDLASRFLELSSETLVTRRFFYWIPAKGDPIKIVHMIESHVLDHFPGEKLLFLKYQTLEEQLAKVLKGSSTVAMEYSPRNANPYVSKVDGGIIDLVRECGVKVVSSAPLMQFYTSTLSDKERDSHYAAADVLDKTVEKAWQLIAAALQKSETITEYDVQQWILSEFARQGCITESPPMCLVNAHAADPHYEVKKIGSSQIKKGDFILIDLWCKKKEAGSIYGDITRVGVAAAKPTERQNEIFTIVRNAQRAATDFIQKGLEAGKVIKGCDVDKVCRKVIEEAGYGQYFIHRTGHNIHTSDHGPGAHIDSLETLDERPLIPRTCFSIEPGIYISGELGVRLEFDIYISENNKMQITGGYQDSIRTLF